ncbi:MAG: chemotaxis protein [Gammaproteobacteria bacterium]|nr:chemotaxis protein [Gammaproteobacteria bacterium]
MLKFLLASGVIMLVLFGWVMVQQLARRFALRHPEFGPYREKGSCGGNCACSGGSSCQRKK